MMKKGMQKERTMHERTWRNDGVYICDYRSGACVLLRVIFCKKQAIALIRHRLHLMDAAWY